MRTLLQKYVLLSAISTIAIIKATLPDANSHPIDKTAYRQEIYEILKGNSQSSQVETNRDRKIAASEYRKTCQSNHTEPNFLVMGGGGAPQNNEIALEKNVLYFQRTIKQIGYDPSAATIFFANGNDGQATIRYIDTGQQEQFKPPEITNLQGASTLENFYGWIDKNASQSSQRPIFFYFTGHGHLNRENDDNNTLILWNQKQLSVRQLSQSLDKFPQNTQIVTMMAQCYSGSFANFIYQEGNPDRPVALQTRCGFFATIKSLPSVGCTPEVNEADYKDYSSSFFAGLSGVNRIGKKVASADYNRDGRVTYAEAHAFAKIDEKTPDLPVSTSEVWLQRKITEADSDRILNRPIQNSIDIARPEQKYVVESLVKMFNFNPNKSYWSNYGTLTEAQLETEEKQAYQVRLIMEIVNIGMEKQIRDSKDENAIAVLDRLIQCEASSWK